VAFYWLKMASFSRPGQLQATRADDSCSFIASASMAAVSLRSRAGNMSTAERDTLVQIALKYSRTIENKRTDRANAR